MCVITKAFKLATPGLGNWQRDRKTQCGKTVRGENCVYKHIKSQHGSNNKQENLFEIHDDGWKRGGGGMDWGLMMLQTVCVQK